MYHVTEKLLVDCRVQRPCERLARLSLSWRFGSFLLTLLAARFQPSSDVVHSATPQYSHENKINSCVLNSTVFYTLRYLNVVIRYVRFHVNWFNFDDKRKFDDNFEFSNFAT